MKIPYNQQPHDWFRYWRRKFAFLPVKCHDGYLVWLSFYWVRSTSDYWLFADHEYRAEFTFEMDAENRALREFTKRIIDDERSHQTRAQT